MRDRGVSQCFAFGVEISKRGIELSKVDGAGHKRGATKLVSMARRKTIIESMRMFW